MRPGRLPTHRRWCRASPVDVARPLRCRRTRCTASCRGRDGRADAAGTLNVPGTLSLTFDDGSRVDIGGDPTGRYEAWSVVAPDGVRAVAMPDGEVAFWDPPPAPQ
ncbi:DUF6188 family protein [Gordonia sp. DT218]|uniref:DUF6188 family protein n=1 Tax=Gordonia sp. DT218 TaxID=3416659 RepID=UPI003CEC891B